MKTTCLKYMKNDKSCVISKDVLHVHWKRRVTLSLLILSALNGGSTSPANTVAPEKWKEEFDSWKPQNGACILTCNANHYGNKYCCHTKSIRTNKQKNNNVASVLWNLITTLFSHVNAFCMQQKLYFWEEPLFCVL